MGLSMTSNEKNQVGSVCTTKRTNEKQQHQKNFYGNKFLISDELFFFFSFAEFCGEKKFFELRHNKSRLSIFLFSFQDKKDFFP